MNQSETMIASFEAADKVITSECDSNLRTMLAAAWMLGMAQGGFEALTQLEASVRIEKIRSLK